MRRSLRDVSAGDAEKCYQQWEDGEEETLPAASFRATERWFWILEGVTEERGTPTLLLGTGRGHPEHRCHLSSFH